MGAPRQRRCHKQAEFVRRIDRALGVKMRNVSCHVVNQEGMAQVMGKAGWSRNQTRGVVGFQLDENVYVLDSAPWTVLHELIHRAGVNSDRLSRFVAEGLTEAIAQELRESPDEHRPTYPKETAWVRERLLPRLGLTAVELGRKIAHSDNPPWTLAELMVEVDPKLDKGKLLSQLKPQRTDQPSFNRGGGCGPTRVPLAEAVRQATERWFGLPGVRAVGDDARGCVWIRVAEERHRRALPCCFLGWPVCSEVGPPFRALGSRARADSAAEGLAGVLLVSGLALAAPLVLRRLAPS